MKLLLAEDEISMLNWIFKSEEYTQLYHQYFAKFIEGVDLLKSSMLLQK
mgnify:CR=1 FL=1